MSGTTIRRRLIRTSEAVTFTTVCVLAIGLIVGVLVSEIGRTAKPVDFIAFRCGGAALLAHINPYLAQSLAACETSSFLEVHQVLATPAIPTPFPGWALAFFALFALIPFLIASSLWNILLIASLVAAIEIMQRLTKFSYLVLLATFLPAFLTITFSLGQVVPLVLFGCVASVYGIANDRPWVVAWSCTLALLEPHIALPLICSSFILMPGVRRALGILLCCVGVIALFLMPITEHVQYIQSVLPSHALSEAFNDDQYSLTHLLVLFSVDPALAVKLGSWEYLVMLVAGVGGAVFINRRTRDPALALAFAPAATLVGGPFIHVHQMTIAAVLALLLCRRHIGFGNLLALSIIALPFGLNQAIPEAVVFPLIAVMLAVLTLPSERSGDVLKIFVFITALAGTAVYLHAGGGIDTGYHARALAYLGADADRIPHTLPEFTWQTEIVTILCRHGFWSEIFPAVTVWSIGYLLTSAVREHKPTFVA